MQLITLTTDFGSQDWFVGAMKGVILGVAPHATIVDLTHEIPPGDIRAGAFALAAACRFFPKGTVHVAVVDPGVGSARRAITVRCPDYFFVGPDNGILSLALAQEKIKWVRRLENSDYFLQPVSHTFHGRDVFAPVAAHLCRGVAMRQLGPAQRDIVRLPWPQPRVHRRRIDGVVVFIDRFGNAITNIAHASTPPGGMDAGGRLFLGRKLFCPVKAFYQSVPAGQAVAVPGSSGFLEIAVNGGSAARRFGLRIDDRISVRW
ncbi:MAG: SAM-dependent chlorinase/fluorinase [Verrucomicrobiota bacterium]